MPISLSHVAVATPKVETVLKQLQALSLEVEGTHDVPSEKVIAAMIPVAVSSEFRIELLEPTDSSSPISKFLEKRPNGGIHHLAFEVTQLDKWVEKLNAAKVEILPPGIRKGARGRVLFIHPKSMGGMLVELEELAH